MLIAGANMPSYRLYHMDPHSGHIDRSEDFTAGDDVEAVHQISQRRRAAPVELWRDGRKLLRVDKGADIWSRYHAGDLPG